MYLMRVKKFSGENGLLQPQIHPIAVLKLGSLVNLRRVVFINVGRVGELSWGELSVFIQLDSGYHDGRADKNNYPHDPAILRDD